MKGASNPVGSSKLSMRAMEHKQNPPVQSSMSKLDRRVRCQLVPAKEGKGGILQSSSWTSNPNAVETDGEIMVDRNGAGRELTAASHRGKSRGTNQQGSRVRQSNIVLCTRVKM